MDPRRCSLCRATSKHLKTGPNPIYFPAWMQVVITQIPCCYLDRQDPVPCLSPTARRQRGRRGVWVATQEQYLLRSLSWT